MKVHRTGYAHPKCYARSLADCSEQITREHYISRNILARFGEIGAMGIAGIESDELKRVSAESLQARVLCERHNNMLSPLDKVASDFFEAVRLFRDPVKAPFGDKSISGRDLELWVLKLACGARAAGQLIHVAEPTGRKEVDSAWVRVLLGTAPMPNSWGLHAVVEGTEMQEARSVSFGPRFRPDRTIGGLQLWLNGLQLAFLFGAATELHTPYPGLFFHPAAFSFEHGGARRRLRLKWKKSSRKVVHVVWRRQFEGPSALFQKLRAHHERMRAERKRLGDSE